MLDEDEFRAWLKREGLSPGTTTAQITRPGQLTSLFGDLEAAHRRDRMASILQGLEYSRADETRGVPAPQALDTSGDAVALMSDLRVTARKVVRFLDGRPRGGSDGRGRRQQGPAVALGGGSITVVPILDAKGRALDAKVEIGRGDIFLHSRSGAGETARNPDYRRALVFILGRLAEEGLRPEVFLDSAPAVKVHASMTAASPVPVI